MTSARGNKTAANRAQVTLDRSSRVGRVERVPPSKVVHRRKMVGLAPLGPPYHYACSAPIPVRAGAKLYQQKRSQCATERIAESSHILFNDLEAVREHERFFEEAVMARERRQKISLGLYFKPRLTIRGNGQN